MASDDQDTSVDRDWESGVDRVGDLLSDDGARSGSGAHSDRRSRRKQLFEDDGELFSAAPDSSARESDDEQGDPAEFEDAPDDNNDAVGLDDAYREPQTTDDAGFDAGECEPPDAEGTGELPEMISSEEVSLSDGVSDAASVTEAASSDERVPEDEADGAAAQAEADEVAEDAAGDEPADGAPGLRSVPLALERGRRYLREHPRALDLIVVAAILAVVCIGFGTAIGAIMGNESYMEEGRDREEAAMIPVVDDADLPFASLLLSSLSEGEYPRLVADFSIQVSDPAAFPALTLESFDISDRAAGSKDSVPVADASVTQTGPQSYQLACTVAEDDPSVDHELVVDLRPETGFRGGMTIGYDAPEPVVEEPAPQNNYYYYWW